MASSKESNSPKEKGFYHNVIKYLREYNETTGIQGLRYLTEKRSLVEKFFWAIILIVSLGGCIYMICEIVVKYNNSPVVVSFATKETPIHQVPFPAVTICPVSKCSARKFNYTDVYFKHVIHNKSVSDEDLQKLYKMTVMCPLGAKALINESSKTTDDSFFALIDDTKLYVKDVCYFSGNKCEMPLTPILTPLGICYTFNILDKTELYKDHTVHYGKFHNVGIVSQNFDGISGYTQSVDTNTYPKRTLKPGGGQNGLLLFLIYRTYDMDEMCSLFRRGFNVYIHSPIDLPGEVKHEAFSISPGKGVSASVQLQLTRTSKSIKRYSPEKRGCYLQSERPLQHFKVYTQSNCLLECKANITLKMCDCVAFYMPRDNNTAICNLGSTTCLNDAEAQLKIQEHLHMSTGIVEEGESYCDCKPLCTELKYSVKSDDMDINVVNMFNTMFKIEEKTDKDFRQLLNNVSISFMSIFFKDEQFVTLERNELYGPSDLISNFGGLLGLFTGFSLISLVEIIYFLTLRIFYNQRLFGLWSGAPN